MTHEIILAAIDRLQQQCKPISVAELQIALGERGQRAGSILSRKLRVMTAIGLIIYDRKGSGWRRRAA